MMHSQYCKVFRHPGLVAWAPAIAKTPARSAFVGFGAQAQPARSVSEYFTVSQIHLLPPAPPGGTMRQAARFRAVPFAWRKRLQSHPLWPADFGRTSGDPPPADGISQGPQMPRADEPVRRKPP